MALTVDQLLAAESSTDDEDGPAIHVGAQTQGKVSTSSSANLLGVLGGGLVAAGDQAKMLQLAKEHTSSEACSNQAFTAATSGPGFTIAEALAQGGMPQEEVRDGGTAEKPVPVMPSVTPCSQQNDTQRASATMSRPKRHAGHTRSGPVDTDVLSDDLETPPGATNSVGLEEIMAMADSSDEEGGAPAPAAATAVLPRAPADAVHKGPQPPREGLATQGVESDQVDKCAAFARAPFAWCLEHERALLSNNVEQPTSVFTSTNINEAASISSFAMLDIRLCLELRRMLAQDFGLPTCVFTHSKYVGVGSLRGSVVLLDPQLQDVPAQPQILSPVGSEDVLAVTAAAFCVDGSSLLVGHKSGQVFLWDLSTSKVAVAVKDVHTSAVLSVAFCRSSWQYALSADAKGSVFLLTFTSTLGRRGCQSTLLVEQSSNIGVPLRILPLPPVPGCTNHPADSQCLVAICATNATVLLTLHPSVQVLKKMQYHAKGPNAGWVPDAAWLRLEMREWIDAAQLQSSDPLLCIAVGQSLHLMRVSCAKQASSREDFKISLVRKYGWSSPIRCIVPFTESLLALLDNANKLNIIQMPTVLEDLQPKPNEVSQLKAVHVEDVSSWSLVYHTQTSLEGNGDGRAHHGALAVFRGRSRTLYLCGMKEVWNVQIGRWGQHIEDLVGKNEWCAALHILLALCKGTLPPLLDFPHETAARQKAVDSRTTQVIQSYLVSGLQPDTGRSQAREMCCTAVSACVEMFLWSVLYKTVFECFKAAGHVNLYCNTLEPFIVMGRIPRGQMDTEVLSSILQSYAVPLEEEAQAAQEHMKEASASSGCAPPLVVDCDHYPQLFPTARRLQQLVLHVEVIQLDLNLAIRLFTQHRLWTALVHLYCSLGDYASPLELLVGECTQLARRCAGKGDNVGTAGGIEQSQIEQPLLQCLLVRKLFFFLYRCFELRCFPLDAKDGSGMVHPGVRTITELLRCIFKTEPPMFLRLLRISPLGLFSALAALYASPSASHALQNHARAEGQCILGPEFHPLTLASLFQAVEAALGSARRRAAEEDQPLPGNTQSEFMWFVARAAPRAKISLPTEECMEVVEHLLASKQAAATSLIPFGCHAPEEAQHLLIGILAAGDPFVNKESRDAFVGKAMRQGFFSVAAWLHERHGEYDRALDCRMHDEELREEIFEYIISRLAEKSTDAVDSSALVEATLQRLPKLVALDAERCAAMICEQFASVADHDVVLQRLSGYPQIELQYFETLLVRHKRSHWKDTQEQHSFFDLHVVRYVELLCLHAPRSVCPFIAGNEALPLRECLELCRRHSVTDASIHLLERTGDFPLVLELLLTDYSAALEQLHATFMQGASQSRVALGKVLKRLASAAESKSQGMQLQDCLERPWWEGLPEARRCADLLAHAYELSSRNSNIMTDTQLEDLWFGLLGRTVRWQERILASERPTKRSTGLATALEELAAQAITGVLAYLSLPRALKWICAEFAASTLGIWKAPLESMLSGLNFQLGLLSAAKAVAAQDVVKPFAAVKRRGSRGTRVCPSATSCMSVSPSRGDCGQLLVSLGFPRRIEAALGVRVGPRPLR